MRGRTRGGGECKRNDQKTGLCVSLSSSISLFLSFPSTSSFLHIFFFIQRLFILSLSLSSFLDLFFSYLLFPPLSSRSVCVRMCVRPNLCFPSGLLMDPRLTEGRKGAAAASDTSLGVLASFRVRSCLYSSLSLSLSLDIFSSSRTNSRP